MSFPGLEITLSAGAAAVMATLLASVFGRLGFALPTAEHRHRCIDGLRGYLALSVLIHHFVIWVQVTRLGGGWTPPSLNLLNQMGAGAVALFFMITGFLFYPVALAGLRSTFWPALLIRRVFRIVPLIALSVALMTALIVWRTGSGLGWDFPRAALIWIATAGMPPLLGYPDTGRLNAYVLWSLRYEWIFYLAVLPLIALAQDGARGRLPSWTVPGALLGGALAAQALGVPGVLVRVLPFFALGMLAHEVQAREALARRLRGAVAGLAGSAALIIATTAAQTPYGWTMALFALFFACVACGNSFGGMLRTRGARLLGELSYGIYLLHGLLLALLFVDAADVIAPLAAGPVFALLPAVAVATLLAALAATVLVERPAIALGQRLARASLRLGRPADNVAAVEPPGTGAVRKRQS